MRSVVAGFCMAPVAATGLLLWASGAQAHARLVDASPSAGAVVGAAKVLTLHFSEKLEPNFSGADLMKANGEPVSSSTLITPAAPKTITVTTNGPLAPGGYKVGWHVVSADGHRTKGEYGFQVR